LFDWAHFRKKKGAIKLHTVLNFDGCVSVFADLSDGKKHDVNAAHDIKFPTGSTVIADRAYVNFKWMRQLDEQGVFFVIRGKENIKLEPTQRPLSPTDQANHHLQCDWQGYLSLLSSKTKYPMTLRMVQVWDEEQQIYLASVHRIKRYNYRGF